MIVNKTDLKNYFFNSLVPFQPIEIRKDLIQSSLYSCDRNWDKRHFFATAYAIKAIALSFFHSLSSLGKALYGFAKNGAQFKFKDALVELSTHSMFSLAHLSVAICAIHCTAVGFFFPKKTYQVFAPEIQKNDLPKKVSFEIESSNDDEAEIDPLALTRYKKKESSRPHSSPLYLRGSDPLVEKRVIPLVGWLHIEGRSFQVRWEISIVQNEVSIEGSIDGREIEFVPIRLESEELSDQAIRECLLAYILPQGTRFSFTSRPKKVKRIVRDLSLFPISARLYPLYINPTLPTYPIPLTDLDLIREQRYRAMLALEAPLADSDYETPDDDDDDSSVDEHPLSSSFVNDHDLQADGAAYTQMLKAKFPEQQTDVNLIDQYALLKEMKDDQAVYFADGRLTPIEPEQSHPVLYSLQLALEHTYGERLGHFILDRYSLRSMKQLTAGDLKKILIGVAANVKKVDLEAAFQSIKGANTLSCLSSLSQEEIASIRKCERFEELPPGQIQLLLSAFRTIGKREISFVKKEAASAICLEDIDKLHSFDFLEKPPEHGAMTISEHFAKWISYQPMGTGVIIAAAPFYLEVVHHFSEKGLQFTLLKPLNAAQHCQEIYALFQGTNCLEGAARDLQTMGVGRSEFNRYSKGLLEALFAHLQGCKSIKVIGHSLGGMDAQRFVLEIAKNLTADHQIDLVQLEAHNAPRGESATYGTGYYDVNVEFEKALSRLDQQGIKTRFNLNYYLFQSLRGGDIVQQYGHVYLGHTCNSVERNVIITTLDAKSNLHTALPFTREFDKVERIERYQNDEANSYLGQVPKNENLKPYTWFSYLPAYPVQKTLETVAKAIIYLKRAPNPYAPNLIK